MPDHDSITIALKTASQSIDLPIVPGATSEEILFLGNDRSYRVIWDNGYALEQEQNYQWVRLIDPGMTVDDFVTAVINEIVSVEPEPSQHSPSPWRVASDWIADAEGQTIAYLSEHHKQLSPDETEINARLIAAAPEMFEVLCLAQPVISKMESTSGELLLKAIKVIKTIEQIRAKVNPPQNESI